MPSNTFNINTADILMLTLRSELLPTEKSDRSDPNYGNTFGRDRVYFDFVKAERLLCIKALMRKWYYPDDADPYYEDTLLDDSQIVRYTIDEQGGESGFDIGTVISASYHLTLDNTTVRRTAADFTNTRFAVALGSKNIGGSPGVSYEPFGVWTVTNVSASEQSATIEIDGLDALGVEYEKTYSPYADGTGESGILIDYGTIGHLMDAVISIYDDTKAPIDSDITAALGTRTDSNGTPYRYSWSAFSVGKYDEDIELSVPSLFYTMTSAGDMSRRAIIGWFAEMEGFFARMRRDGTLYFTTYAVNPAIDPGIYINPSLYFTYTPLGVGPFQFNQLTAQYYDSNSGDEQVMTYKLKQDVVSNASNTLQMAMPPLLLDEAYDRIYMVYARSSYHLKAEAMTVTYCGAPNAIIGDHFKVTDLNGVQHEMIVNSMSSTYDGGLSQTISCNLPSAETAYSASYNAHQTLLERINTSTNLNTTDKLDVTAQYSINKTAGKLTINSFNVYKCGALMFFQLNCSMSGATSPGKSVFEGTISGPWLPSFTLCGMSGFWATSIEVFFVEPTGKVTLRAMVANDGPSGGATWSGVRSFYYFI